jgi:hypothetical protein
MRNFVHGSRRRRFGVGLALAMAVPLVSLAPASASVDTCSNALIRQEDNSSALPDCRAYEMVSPSDKDANDLFQALPDAASSTSGNALVFTSSAAFGDVQSAAGYLYYRSVRGEAGWETHGVVPPVSSGGLVANTVEGFSEDLTHEALSWADPPLAPGAAEHTRNLYLRNNETGSYQLLDGAETESSRTAFAAASQDYSHILFESTDVLAPKATSGVPNVYEEVNGEVRLVSILPDGEADTGGAYPGPGKVLGGYTEGPGALGANYTYAAMSRDGSRIFWSDDANGQIYVRLDGTTTVEVTASQRTTPDPEGEEPKYFLGATPDGSKVFFESDEKLTNDSTASQRGSNPDEATDLYMYDVDSGVLTDLSVSPTPGAPAFVQGLVGISEDGSYVYFAADGALKPGAVSGTPNVYLWHNGEVRLVTPLSESLYDQTNWESTTDAFGPKGAQVSADGRFLLITSPDKLTSYETAGFFTYYRYDAEDSLLQCVSCNPRTSQSSAGATDSAPETVGTGLAFLRPRRLSESGQVFFNTPEALLATDTNGKQDVYEWDGAPHLISSGQSSDDSWFQDASPNGSDVFLSTREQLLPEDQDNNVDIYDARVGGGFPQPAEVACTGTGCQGVPPTPPIFATPASVTFGGVGNFAAAPKAKVKAKTKTKTKARKTKKKKAKKKKRSKKPKSRKSLSRRTKR